MRAKGAVRLYESLLVLYPRPHRDEYGPDMVQLFADRYRDERPGGDFFRFVRFWGGMIADIFKTALAERTESVVSSFKQSWWKWAIGLLAAMTLVFPVESVARLIGDRDGIASIPRHLVLDVATPLLVVALLLIGLRVMRTRPRVAAVMLTIGLLPVASAGAIFFWAPPMWVVSVIGISLIVKVNSEAGRLTRDVAVV